jgi:hypothetical protein
MERKAADRRYRLSFSRDATDAADESVLWSRPAELKFFRR